MLLSGKYVSYLVAWAREEREAVVLTFSCSFHLRAGVLTPRTGLLVHLGGVQWIVAFFVVLGRALVALDGTRSVNDRSEHQQNQRRHDRHLAFCFAPETVYN